jgi:electron transport complex protein RnfC
MIKRSFFALAKPELHYDLIEPDLKEPVSIPIPSNLTLLLNEPIDGAKKAIIAKGDAVKKGQKLCLYGDSTEYTISPVTGTIKNIDTYSDDFGNVSTFVVINSDQSQTAPTESITYDLKEDIASADEFLRTLPGAPPLKFLADADNKIKTLIISCGDADLLTTTRQYVTSMFLDDIKEGAKVLKKITGIPKFCITTPQGSNIQGEFDSIQVFKTSLTYPANSPAMILKDHFNTVLPAGKKPEDLGFCFITAEAVASIGKAYRTKTGDFEKVITIIGKGGTQYRIKATIGTPLRKIFNNFSIHINEKDRVIIGGPMTGTATYSHYHPVVPDMDTVLIQDRDIIPEVSDDPCVNCGKCIRVCPAKIPVNILVRYLEADEYDEAADKYDLESCIGCGLCAYVCTAKIPIYQYIRLGKHELIKLRADA